MPIVLTPPSYGASREGLVSRYSATFTGDYQIVLPLEGSFQGDAVRAISLLIDNYNNGIPVSYMIGGDSDYIPAYTSQTIDVTGMHTIVLSSTDAIKINLSVFDRLININRSRGLPPNGVSDPLWANVLGLWHFNAQNGANIAIDSRNSGLYVGPSSNGFISSAQSLFGGTSMHITSATGLSNMNETFAPAGAAKGNYTLEFSAYVVSSSATAGVTELCGVGENETPGSNIVFIAEQSGTQYRIAVYRRLNTGGDTFICASPYTLNYNAWVTVALTTLGQYSLYTNGNLASVGGLAFKNLFGNIFWNNNTAGEFYFDECRLTLSTRYVNNYVPAGQEFPNQ